MNGSDSPRIGNGLVWTVSLVDGNILCDAVGDIALELGCGSAVCYNCRELVTICLYHDDTRPLYALCVRVFYCLSFCSFSLTFIEHPLLVYWCRSLHVQPHFKMQQFWAHLVHFSSLGRTSSSIIHSITTSETASLASARSQWHKILFA